MAALVDPGRGFDALVVGGFERAFYGDQFRELAPLFKLYGVQLWLPELDVPVDTGNEHHLSLLALLGVHSKREVQRSRFRAKVATCAQVIEHDCHLGGRPPYGYRLVIEPGGWLTGQASDQSRRWSLERRTTSSGWKTTCRWPWARPDSASSSSSSAAVRPSCSRGWRTDDNGTAAAPAN